MNTRARRWWLLLGKVITAVVILGYGSTSTIAITTEHTAATRRTPALANSSTMSANSGAGAVTITTQPAGAPSASIVTQNGVRVAQDAPSCRFDIRPANMAIASSGGTTNVSVSARDGCQWTADSSAPWITIASRASVTGSGSITLSVARNGGSARIGYITIAGQTFAVTQDGIPVARAGTYNDKGKG